ncbi:iron uptake system protein EfeO [Bacillus massiliigorillae]|uniref:iron uptake system protein EfeO n=1 Tax=Bacillus massiliigorillae TaxID=1243664 RepID=UPI0003A4337F|nr:iron uptake system protein EfeO [Bacillus massiliigorillae]
MKIANKGLKIVLMSSLLAVPALAGCNNDSSEKTTSDKPKETATVEKDNGVKTIAESLQKSLQNLTAAIDKNDKVEIEKLGKELNSEWLKKENGIRETFPLLYTEVEKYMQPLYIGATGGAPDQKKLQELAGQLDASLTKLASAKETEEKTSDILNQAVGQYEKYVNEEITALVASTKLFTDAVRAKDVEKAKQYYIESRVHYERVEPVAESFGDLDPKIDAREGDVDEAEWGGFHKIEKALWMNEPLEPMAAVADQLDANILELEKQVKELKLRPTTVVAGAMELINEAAISKITGEEERYSHVDLMDLAANVEGSQAVYFAILPALNENNRELGNKLDAQFTVLTDTLQQYKKNGQYVLYTELTKDQVRDISQKLAVLAELMGQTAKILQ